MQLRSILLVSTFILAGAPAYAADGGQSSALSALNLHGNGNVTRLQVSQPRNHVANARIYDAVARNIGPPSSTTGYAESELGSAASGNDQNPLAPAAGGNGMGGN